MAAFRSFLSSLVLSAVVLTGLSAPATAQSLPLDDNLPPTSGPNGHLSGSRTAAAMVKRSITDAAKVEWNPTTGNFLLTAKLLHIEGADRDIDLSWRYNSINDYRPTLSEGTLETALQVGADNSMTYTAADGGTYKFVPKAGGGWTMPPGLNASVTAFTATGVTLRFNDTGHTNFYEKVDGVFRLAFAGDHYSNTADRIDYDYDSDGRLASITTPNNREITFEYLDSNNTGQPSRITDTSLNRTILIDYDALRRMRTITDAAGADTVIDYDANGEAHFITDGRGVQTELLYWEDGRAKYANFNVGGGGGTNAWTSDLFGYSPYDNTGATLSDVYGRDTNFSFNAARQVTSIVDPLGNVTTKTYNTHDDVLSTLDDLGNLTTSTYNPNNTLASVTSPAGATGGTGKQVTYTYPAATAGEAWLEFQPLTSTDSEGSTTTYAYDSATQRQSQILTPSGQGGTVINRYQGDSAGTSCGALRGQLCKKIDGNGNETSITYDVNRNPVTITRPAPLGVITNTFDAAGRVATNTDGKGQTAIYVYDGNDRLLQTRFGATCEPASCVTYTYDANGNLTTRVDGSGTTTHVYDQMNRPLSKTIGGVTTSLTYDRRSNVTSFTDPTGTANYSYDAGDRLTALAEPGGSCPATPAFPNTTKCTAFTYDDLHRRTSTKYPNGVKNTTVFDKAGRTTSITATNTATAVLAKRSYTYTVGATGKDGALRKTMTTEAGEVTTYAYDKMARLTSAVNGTVTESWTYDANGNRLTSAKTGVTTVNAAFNAADQLCWTSTGTGTCAAPPVGATTYTYDANGNQASVTNSGGTWASTWNTFDQLTSHNTTSLTYAGQGNTERLTSGAMSFLNGSLGITRQTNANGTTSFIRDPKGTLISMRNSAGASFYYTTDALGSTILLTDSAQAKAATYLYDSWGGRKAQTGTQATVNPWRYAGGYIDATGYTKFGARYYSAGTGRFSQPDPSWQEANRYLYAGANPVNFTDPTGLAVGELGGTVCLFACISLGLAQDDVTGAYAISGGFGAGTPGVAANVKVGPGEVSTSVGPEGSCGVGPITLSLGAGGGGLGVSSGFSSGLCTVQWTASLRIG